MTLTNLRCGDLVTEIEGKHIGKVLFFIGGNGRPLFVTIQWCGSGWVSTDVAIDTLAFAPADEI